MKKLLAVLLIALLAIPAALAETAVMTTYTDAEKGFSVAYPDTWYLVDDNFRETLLEAMGDLEMDLNGVDMESTIESVRQSGMFMLFAPDLTSNLNITTTTLGMSASAQLLAEALLPTTLAQYQSMFGDSMEDITGNDSIVTFGENEYAHLAISYDMTISGMQSHQTLHQYFICPNSEAYIITVTLQDGYDEALMDDVADILASFSATK